MTTDDTAEKVGQMLQLDARDGVDQHVLDRHAGSLVHASPRRSPGPTSSSPPPACRSRCSSGDCVHRHGFLLGTTVSPIQLGIAATWDPALVEQAARVTAIEAAATGCMGVLAGVVHRQGPALGFGSARRSARTRT